VLRSVNTLRNLAEWQLTRQRAVYGHGKGAHGRMEGEFQVSLKTAGTVTEEPFVWTRGRGPFDGDVSQAVTFPLWEAVERREGGTSAGGVGRRRPSSEERSRHKEEAGEGEEMRCPVLSSSRPCWAGPPIAALEPASGGPPLCRAAVVPSTRAVPGPAYLHVLSQRLRIHSALLRAYIPCE